MMSESLVLVRMAGFEFIFFFSSRRRHTRCSRDWSSDVCSSDLPLAPVVRDAEPQELALLRSRHRAFRLVDLQPQLLGQKPAHRGHHPFTGAAAANIDIAVVRVAAKAVTPSGQLLVEIIEHEIA